MIRAQGELKLLRVPLLLDVPTRVVSDLLLKLSHLFDLVNPDETYSVGRFVRESEKVIKKLKLRKSG